MVALTVIMAAIIASMAFGLVESVPMPPIIGVTANLLPDGSQIYITYIGGPDQARLESMTIQWPDGTPEPWPNPQLGQTYQSTGSNNLTHGKDHLVVVGHFKDTTDQVVLDTMF